MHLACMLHSMLGSLLLEQTALTVHYLRDEPASFIASYSSGLIYRFKATGEWCQGMQGVLAALSGVKVLRFEEDCIAVRLLTSFHASWQPTGVHTAIVGIT